MTGDRSAPGEPPAAAARGVLPWQRLASTGNLEYDRVLFFTDAIFAIAITLLVVDIRVPAVRPVHAGLVLRDTVPQMVGFAISFVVIGMFWVGHHGTFRHIVAMDRWLIWLNLLFCGTIAFLPYPTSLLSATSSQLPAIVFYAAWVSLAGLAELAVWLYACRIPGLLSAGTTPWLRRYVALRIARLPAVFLLSIPVAFAWPWLATYTWILVAVLGIGIRQVMARSGRTGGGELE